MPGSPSPPVSYAGATAVGRLRKDQNQGDFSRLCGLNLAGRHAIRGAPALSITHLVQGSSHETIARSPPRIRTLPYFTRWPLGAHQTYRGPAEDPGQFYLRR